MVVLVIVVVVLLVLGVLLTPWRRRETDAEVAEDQRLQVASTAVLDLQAARDAKYREIRDAELDRETGHLTGADFSAVDATLRAEAVEILKRLDRAEARLAKLRAQAEAADLPRDPDLDSARGSEPAEASQPADDDVPEEPADDDLRKRPVNERSSRRSAQ